MLPVLQEGAREGRREAELQIRFGAQLGQVPFRELPAQEEPEAFAKHQAAASPPEIEARAAAQVHQKHDTLATAEALHPHLKARGRGLPDAGDAAGEVARAVPGLQREAVSAQFEREVVGADGQQFLTGFEQRGLPGVFEESLNRRTGFFGAAAFHARNAGHATAW